MPGDCTGAPVCGPVAPGIRYAMVRALVTLVGLAAAAALFYAAPELEDGEVGWWAASLWAAAGLAVGLAYQAGGVRAPGLRMNLPLLVLAFLPWAALTAGLVALEASPGSAVADAARSVLPGALERNWPAALPAWAFAAGLLLALATIEPRVAREGDDAAARREGNGYGRERRVDPRASTTNGHVDEADTIVRDPRGDPPPRA
jgi:hypothetical protein